MALFHFTVTQTKRSKGQSAIASAAYRSGEKLYSEYYGEYSDYTRKRGVICSDILLPPHAPKEYADRQTLWNAVEKAERGKNAQLAYSFEISLQNEFSLEENIALAREFLFREFVSRGMTVDVSFHEKECEDGGTPNPHFHFLCPIRPMEQDGTWGIKQRREYVLDEEGNRIRDANGKYVFNAVPTTDWGSPETLEHWREAWAEMCNAKFAEKGLDVRIDHRSYERQGIEQIPTVHIGVAASQMEKKGIATEKGELNRNIQKANRLIREIRAQIGKLKEWISDLFKARETAPEQPPQSPNLANLLMKYLSVQREKSRKYSQSWQHQHAADELKTIAAAVNYLSEHGISNLDELDASLSSVSDKAYSIREGMKTAEQRMKELQKLMEYGRNYQTYKPIQDEYRQIRWKGKQEKFAEARRAELTLWDAANRYLRANLPKGTKTLPIAEWEQEYADLKTQRDSDYTKLKDTRTNVSELQKIRKCVDIALRADQPEQTQSRTKRQEQER